MALTAWIAYSWPQPVYYSYGDGGDVYYQDDSVYVDGKENCSADAYYQQAAAIASNVPEIDNATADKMEWMPLGVFALTQDGVNESNLTLQLAVSKDGMIGGTLQNESTSSTRPVEGAVDKKTQRAAWSPTDGKNIDVVMETSIYNLTKDQCSALVHFGANETQKWIMVRLDPPESEKSKP